MSPNILTKATSFRGGFFIFPHRLRHFPQGKIRLAVLVKHNVNPCSTGGAVRWTVGDLLLNN